jgi:hypothetical protein
MPIFVVGVVCAFAWSNAGAVGSIEPNEAAMRQAFASDLAEGIDAVLAFVAQTGGPQALARIRQAHTDTFDIRAFRKVDCRRSGGKPGHLCDFVVAVDTIAGPIERTVSGRFFVGPDGLAFDHDA